MFHHIEHVEVRPKYSAALGIFLKTLLSLFGNVVKHGLSCLMYSYNPPFWNKNTKYQTTVKNSHLSIDAETVYRTVHTLRHLKS